jgi:carboxymethylenebutenolidase
MVDIAVPYFFARPAAPPPWPGVVVVLEGNGMSPQLLRVCQRLAHAGFAALAPDLFWRFGGSDPDTSVEWLRSMRLEDVSADLAEAVAVLRDGGASSVGITGFCMGGRYTYLAAVSDADVQCAAPFYGAGIAHALGEPRCPLLAFFGGRDEYISSADIEAVQRHHPGQVVVYPEARHGFMRDGSDSFDEAAAADAWGRLLAFFGEHLH